MPIKYFQSSWNDIKHSKGWFGRLCLLALVNIIPIFGQIVTLGYLYGWAREMAWGSRQPMPEHIIDNRDGKFWRRGWFALIVSAAFALVAAIVMGVGQAMQGGGYIGVADGRSQGIVFTGGWMMVAGMMVYALGWIANLFLQMFVWIASMRVSIYDRLSAGFQLGKIWKMFRHDTGGMFKIFGMNLLISVLIGLVVALVYAVVLLFTVLFGVTVAGIDGSGSLDSSLVTPLFGAFGIVAVIFVMAVVFFTIVGVLFVDALTVRAMGYWTSQFDVAQWRGQDDPMPFEIAQAIEQQPPAGYAQPEAYEAPAVTGYAVDSGANQPAVASNPGDDLGSGEPSVTGDGAGEEPSERPQGE